MDARARHAHRGPMMPWLRGSCRRARRSGFAYVGRAATGQRMHVVRRLDVDYSDLAQFTGFEVKRQGEAAQSVTHAQYSALAQALADIAARKSGPGR